MNLLDYLEKINLMKIDVTSSCKVHLVVGNESADLDSVISPFIYAFYLSKKNSECVCFPVIWCVKEDIVLRTEVVALFKKHGLPLDHLLYKNDWPFLKERLEGKNIEVTLVDHNHGREHEELNPFVNNIIDHHEDSMDFVEVPKQIQFVGSCATLIAEQIRHADNTFFESSKEACEMLLATILIDTYNLDLHSGRTCEQDVFTAEVLSTIVGDVDTDQLFMTIQTAKMDFTSMNTFNILRKDFKHVPKINNEDQQQQNGQQKQPNLGVSSVTMDGDVLITREDFQETVNGFMAKKELDLLLVMFVCFQDTKDGQPTKQLLLVSNEACGIDNGNNILYQLCSYLNLNHGTDLCLAEKELSSKKVNNGIDLTKVAKFFDHNPRWSRKTLMPVLCDFIKSNLR